MYIPNKIIIGKIKLKNLILRNFFILEKFISSFKIIKGIKYRAIRVDANPIYKNED